MSYMEGLRNLKTTPTYYIIKHQQLQTYTPTFYLPDGVHLNPKGTAELVRHYKAAISADLGLNYTLEAPLQDTESANY